ncbi:LPS export ABC transporter periplasmic protein LptC [bacterium]|nr:LPS export ABC transporter periplasmic protein LptC [bacterium]
MKISWEEIKTKINFDIKKKDKFYLILVSVIVIALLWAFVSAAFITRTFKKNAAENKLDNKKVYVEDLLLTETKDGKKYWEIYADKGYYSDDKKIAYIGDSIGNFYENDEVIASFQSPRATINSETGKITLYDRSKLMYKDFTSIVADEFIYEGNKKPVYAKGNVVIEKPQELYITGDDAVLSEDMTHFTINGKVVTKMYEKGK